MREIRQTKDGRRPDTDKGCSRPGWNDIWALEDPAISGTLPCNECDPRRNAADGEWR